MQQIARAALIQNGYKIMLVLAHVKLVDIKRLFLQRVKMEYVLVAMLIAILA